MGSGGIVEILPYASAEFTLERSEGFTTPETRNLTPDTRHPTPDTHFSLLHKTEPRNAIDRMKANQKLVPEHELPAEE
ncbi:hypothetical protein PCC9214_05565 [Planktothrix tepida]|uniref:Uncharacterized protein n=1 Tax=Planktothrix tepida PCC 9214 TaxID=671072 RepID=A0A1J1LVI2_9CYAN|nr:hypothetical protein PCC9214_05565 [Planktothrix tepida]CUR35681.1 hypothetical protein PL9214670307 [Planktothrix tepida PCC 9214]